MNGAHIHLISNHFPIIIPIAGIIVLVIGLLLKSEVVKRVSYFLFLLGAVSTAIVMANGELAEEVAENIAGISEGHIHEHEEAAELFSILSYILGALALATLWLSYKKNNLAKWLGLAVLAMAICTVFFAQKAGTSGGEIRHTEIRKDYQAPASNAEADDDDED